MEFEKKYWSNKEFSRENGEDYVGYVGILDNQGYIFDTEEKLIKNDSWHTEIHCSDMFFDRILDEPLKLPYDKSEVSLQANDFLDKSILRTILKKLQYNNQYIFKNAILSDTLIPAIDDCSVYATEDNSDFYFKYGDGQEAIKCSAENKEAIEAAYVINPTYNSALPTPADAIIKDDVSHYPLKINQNAKGSYGNYQMIPDVYYKISINPGNLVRYNMSSMKSTKTALDENFYKIPRKE